MVEWAPKNGCHQSLCSQGESQLPSASSRCSPRWAGGFDSGSSQIAAHMLGLKVCEILHAFLKAESVTYSPPVLPYASPACLQRQMFWGLFFLMQDLWAGVSDVRLRPLTPWREPLQLWLFSCHLPEYVDFDHTTSPPLLPISLWFLLYIFSCGNSFLLVFRLFSLIVAL